jgi:hypothetical protein
MDRACDLNVQDGVQKEKRDGEGGWMEGKGYRREGGGPRRLVVSLEQDSGLRGRVETAVMGILSDQEHDAPRVPGVRPRKGI